MEREGRQRKTVPVRKLEQVLVHETGVVREFHALNDPDPGRTQASLEAVSVIIRALNRELGLDLTDPFEKKIK